MKRGVEFGGKEYMTKLFCTKRRCEMVKYRSFEIGDKKFMTKLVSVVCSRVWFDKKTEK